MSKYLSAFQKARDAEPISEFAKNLPHGHHKVAIDLVRVKKSQKTKEEFVEAEFIVLETASDKTKPGQRHSWTWFFNTSGFPGQYASARLNEFLETIKTSVGSDQDIAEIGAALADSDHPEYARGITLLVEIAEAPDPANPDKCLKSKKSGRDIHNAFWTVLEQSEDDIAATCALMKDLQASIASTKSVTAAKPVQVAEPAQAAASSAGTATTKTGGIKRLLGGGAK